MWLEGSKVWTGGDVWEFVKSDYTGYYAGVSIPTGYKKLRVTITSCNTMGYNYPWKLKLDNLELGTVPYSSSGTTYTAELLLDFTNNTYVLSGDYDKSGTFTGTPVLFEVAGTGSRYKTMEMYGVPA